jgi:hypothetical protein
MSRPPRPPAATPTHLINVESSIHRLASVASMRIWATLSGRRRWRSVDRKVLIKEGA